MTINCCDLCIAVTICSIITILLYIISWLTYEEKDEENFKECSTSNMQGLDNEQPIPRGELNEILNYDSEKYILTRDRHSSGEIIYEISDISRLQNEDLRLRIAKHDSFISNKSATDVESEHHNDSVENDLKVFNKPSDDITIEDQNDEYEYDPVVHPDSKPGRLHLSIRYDNERSKLIVQILNAQGLIEPEQVYSREMCLKFTLIGPYNNEDVTEKHVRVIVENAPIIWKEPMTFCTTFENAIKHNLYIYATNNTDPVAPRDREISIPLNNLDSQAGEINEWFDLQFVQSSY
ncbi:unnamed protein product [Rotaria sp. Silwood1]|nr:unnamed protein product [Rotaria sp. Silwood1]CAF1590109.1 unnamed protein product [Rotaria sp. Silwood1]CAF3680344.1 unnamed protein product [Rotaria sp. Silwood1]CAF3683720.1 unnamed protein product [Rotaria sp. Silwood1]CAF3696800.1 unnamed protein product [Rotaria sp. Silwood1]